MPQSGSVVYILSNFTKVSETFILREILALRRAGTPVQVVALHRVRYEGLSPEEEACVQEALFVPRLFLPSVLLANLLTFLQAPGRYLKAFRQVMGLPHRSLYFVLRALIHFLAVGYAARALKQPVARLHAHFASVQTEMAMGLAALLNVPFSFTAHAKDIYVDANALREKIAGAQFVVTCSDYNARYLRRLCPGKDPAHVVVIRCGVPVGEISWAFPESPRPPLILSVGRLVEKKGHRHLIEACQMLKDQGVSFECVIIGDGPLRDRIAKDLDRRGLRDCVTLRGSLPYSQVRMFYRRATIFVLPSLMADNGDREGLPIVLMEAMAFGVPVVSTWNSGIPELVVGGETGLLTEPGSARSLAEAMERLIEDETLRRKLSASGRKKVETGFSLERSALRLTRLFENTTTVKPQTRSLAL